MSRTCSDCRFWKKEGRVYSPQLLVMNNPFHNAGYCRKRAPVDTVTHDLGQGSLSFTTIFAAEAWVSKYDSHEGSSLGLRRAFIAGLARGREEERKRIWRECMKNVNPINLEYEAKLKRIIFGGGG